MAKITFTITVDVPEGFGVTFDTPLTATITELPAGIPEVVQALMNTYVPERYQPFAQRYVERCITELGCTVESPDSAARVSEYLNIFPPPRCRRARVSALTYTSTRTAVYCGTVALDGYKLAEQTLSNGTYVHPKLAQLDSNEAVDEAIELTKLAIKRVER